MITQNISLRDYFAASVISGVANKLVYSSATQQSIVEQAYRIADMMLTERKKEITQKSRYAKKKRAEVVHVDVSSKEDSGADMPPRA